MLGNPLPAVVADDGGGGGGAAAGGDEEAIVLLFVCTCYKTLVSFEIWYFVLIIRIYNCLTLS